MALRVAREWQMAGGVGSLFPWVLSVVGQLALRQYLTPTVPVAWLPPFGSRLVVPTPWCRIFGSAPTAVVRVRRHLPRGAAPWTKVLSTDQREHLVISVLVVVETWRPTAALQPLTGECVLLGGIRVGAAQQRRWRRDPGGRGLPAYFVPPSALIPLPLVEGASAASLT